MRTIILAVASLVSGIAFSQNWDRPMQVRKMDININANAFMATTFVSIEFYNPNDTEIEGLYRFELSPGQAITAFQLDLFGKLRDGSMEERWKAANAYNTIVGKRVDPALLQMDYYNHYSLRIYPVPAKGTRRITMTIQQLLTLQQDSAMYRLPLMINDTIKQLNTQVHFHAGSNNSGPVINQGLLKGQVFNRDLSSYSLWWEKAGVRADKPICFSVPMPLRQPLVCTRSAEGKTYFAVRFKPGIQRAYTIRPGKIAIYWDISLSGRYRNTEKEIEFLREYISKNNSTHITIISFNHRIKDSLFFHRNDQADSQWAVYLRSLNYEGAKQYGVLDFSRVDADAILLFSNGRNSFGRDLPVPGHTHVFCVNSTSAYNPDSTHLRNIIGKSGGRYINLGRIPVHEAVEAAGKAENVLFSVTSPEGKVHIDQPLQDLRIDTLLITGHIAAASAKLNFYFGNNNTVHAEENIVVGNIPGSPCENYPLERIPMLAVFDKYIKAYNWQSGTEFGKKEKVVTPATSYIVLEKLEDYIKFKITPPKELEPLCDMELFVDATEKRKQEYRKQTEFDILSALAGSYNKKIKWWDNKESLISLEKPPLPRQPAPVDAMVQEGSSRVNSNRGANAANAPDFPPGAKVLMGTEVVVTAMGQTRQPKELSYAVSTVRAAELTQAKPVNFQNGLTGKVSGLNVQTVNNGVFANTRITLRGVRSLTGNNQPLLVLDGLPLPLSYASRINVNDILNVVILKSSASTAVYGPDGVNGAIVVTTRKGSRLGRYLEYRGLYKLNECEDVDYLAAIKVALYSEKISTYRLLKATYGHVAGFYFDMAEHLFRQGFRKEALTILYSASDVSNGDRRVQKATGYILESLGQIEEAITVYRALLSTDSTDLHSWRDLALSYYQNSNYQQSVNTFYQGLARNNQDGDSTHRIMRSMMLQEMNAVIAVHRDSLDLSGIRNELIKELPVDLRITIDCNNGDLYNKFSVAEPGRVICSGDEPLSKNGGLLSTDPKRSYLNSTADEYQIKQARKGRYRIRINYVDSWYGNDGRMPTVIKIATFRNMGRMDQTLEVSFAILDNQFGLVEIGDVKW